MELNYHPSGSRGHADHGWLKSSHSFSFASYYNPERMQFGQLKVLNDDTVIPAMGFGTHPHNNMEIISIPLKGALEHKDSMGHTQVIHENEIQVMSAGTGIYHSEYNHSKTEPVGFLQLWIVPDGYNYSPRYDQKHFDPSAHFNNIKTYVGPKSEGYSLWIHQNAYISRGRFVPGVPGRYGLRKPGNGIYVFLLEGKIKIDNQILEPKDALGITGADEIQIESQQESEFIIIEIPMQ